MAKLELSEAQNTQLEDMVKQKKDNGEIREFFRSNYQLEIPTWKFVYVREKVFGKNLTQKRKYKHRSIAVGKSENQPVDNIIKEITDMLKDIDTGYQAVFKHLRGELVRSRAQVYNMLKGAGIAAPDQEEL
jgi:hypothetical protein